MRQAVLCRRTQPPDSLVPTVHPTACVGVGCFVYVPDPRLGDLHPSNTLLKSYDTLSRSIYVCARYVVDVPRTGLLVAVYDQALPGDVVLYLPEAERVGELKSDAQPRAGSAISER